MTGAARKQLLAELRTCDDERANQIVATLLGDMPSDNWIRENMSKAKRQKKPTKPVDSVAAAM